MMPTGQYFWAEGDLCIYKSPQTEQFYLGFVKKVDPVTKLCTIQSPLIKTESQVNSEDLSTPTLKEKAKIIQSPLNKSAVLLADGNFFSRKLQKIIGPKRDTVPKVSMETDTYRVNEPTGWAPGDVCICTWSEDGSYYYASITEADPKQDRYLITYFYYENQETKRATDLHELGTDFEMLVEDDQNKAAMLNRNVPRSMKPNAHRAEVEQAEEKFATVLNFKMKKPVTGEKTRPVEFEHTAVRQQPPSSTTRASPAESPGDRLEPDPVTNATLNSVPNSFVSGDHSSPLQAAQSAISNLARLSNVDQFHSMPNSAWQALLISWFMCGYHTGYYETIVQLIGPMYPSRLGDRTRGVIPDDAGQ
ncbi:unnamed protein product [Echinostoma caproni]|uniref:Tudor domain-containing protein n=1 Tax=Echinostoma caproni TaxID=27848 RepID=A0A183ATT3_9TREM|nr:unnamed protein product [Echinostoma caproni]